MAEEAIIVIMLACFLVGYTIGRGRGGSDGYNLGKRVAIMEQRIEAYETGRCPICGATSDPVESSSGLSPSGAPGVSDGLGDFDELNAFGAHIASDRLDVSDRLNLSGGLVASDRLTPSGRLESSDSPNVSAPTVEAEDQ